ncbi:MAG TPA: lysophospholipid acyltransferase family protein [Spirochaetia bacterium]|nr:lysophospholipid acyltransferase family protein [Spirochaetia bacterium]
MNEPATATPAFKKVRLVNRIFYRVMTLLLRRFIIRYFQLEQVDASVVPETGSGILLANHTTMFDPIWLYVLLPRPVYFAATEDLFRQRALGRLIRWFGAFPKRKAASDITALRSIFSISEKGGLIGVFPEGVRSWDGTTQPISHGIAKLIKKLRVPVYTCRFDGAYFVYPRWAHKWRRFPVRAVFSRLYQPENIPDDDERIAQDIATALHNQDESLAEGRPGLSYKGLAVDVTHVLYRCPSCGTLEGLKIVRPVSTNRVECSSCFSSWVVDVTCRLSPVDEEGKPEGIWTSLSQYYARIRAMPFTPIRSEARLGLAPAEQIYLISRPHFLFRQDKFPNLRRLALGRAFLTNKRLLFRTRLGIPLAAPLSGIGSLSVDPGDKLHFTFQGRLYRIPFRFESALKWFDSILRLREDERSLKETARVRADAAV